MHFDVWQYNLSTIRVDEFIEYCDEIAGIDSPKTLMVHFCHEHPNASEGDSKI